MPIQIMDPKKVQAAIEQAGESWQAGPTSVTELPPEERILRLGFVPGPDDMSLKEREQTAQLNAALPESAAAAIGAPAGFDLRDVNGKNFITPVKDQGGCGSCVAFGSVATVEGTLRFQTNNPNLAVDLSEAHLFYCQARAQGRMCSGPNGGWWVPPALDCFKGTGVTDDACYPYTAVDQNCTNLCSTWQSKVTKINGWHAITNPADMKNWLSTKGPLVTCFTVYNDFFSYHTGVYKHVTGAVAGGHCVSCVGYNDAGRYWICKNSWGTGWGDGGFFKIAYGDCGIDAVMYAVDGVTPQPGAGRVPLYRYWNPGICDHFYTTNWAELGSGRYGWGYEGIQCYVQAQPATGTVPLYRYWNPNGGDHFYTTNWAELGSGRYGWAYEGVQCYVRAAPATGTIPLYRYWNPSGCDHFYTTNWSELGSGRNGWGYEGIQCYVYGVAVASQAEAGPGAAVGDETPVPDSFSTTGDGTVPGTFSLTSPSEIGNAGSSFASFDTSQSSGPDDSFTTIATEKPTSGGGTTITINVGSKD